VSTLSEQLPALKQEEKRALLARLLREKADRPVASYPLSHGQRGLWFLHQLEPEGAAYNEALAWRIRSGLDVAALQAAFRALSDRHPALRTTYLSRAGEVVQQVRAGQRLPFEVADASTWTQEELQLHVAEEARRPFDLERGPLLRLKLFARPQQEHVLLTTVHHVAVDLWSMATLMQELQLLYAAQKTGVGPVLPPLAFDYKDFVRWQAQMLAGPEGERHRAYWQQQLAGELPVLGLATDRPRPPVRTYRGAAHALRLSEELTGRLKALAVAEQATLFTLLLAAFQTLLYRYTGQEDMAPRKKSATSDLDTGVSNVV
jgi:hypothetical protein